MRYKLLLPELPDSAVELRLSGLALTPKMYVDEQEIVRSAETGKPFLLPASEAEPIRAYYKQPSFSDPNPYLEIGREKHAIGRKLAWYDYLIALLPFCLVFIGGLIGGGIGATGAFVNMHLLRQEENTGANYAKAIGITAACYFLYFIIAGTIHLYANGGLAGE